MVQKVDARRAPHYRESDAAVATPPLEALPESAPAYL